MAEKPYPVNKNGIRILPTKTTQPRHPRREIVPPDLYTDAGDALDPLILTDRTIDDTLFLLDAFVFLPAEEEDDPSVVTDESVFELRHMINGCLTKHRYATHAEINREQSRLNCRGAVFLRYRCVHCLGWHLATTRKQKDLNGGRRSWKAMGG